MRRGTQAHLDATWHSGPRGSATGAHAAPMRHEVTGLLFIFIVNIWFIVHISLPIIGIMLTHIFDVPYIPACLL